jgi:hypothetical protein
MSSDLATLVMTLCIFAWVFWVGRVSARIWRAPDAAAEAPPLISVADGDAQLGAKIRSTLESMTLKARFSGRGFVIEQRASAQIHGLRIAIHYTLETDQLPRPVEVEARR